MTGTLGMTVEAATQVFFDRDAVLRAIEPRTRRLLSKFGAYTRQRARGLIRTNKKTSKAGRPPYSHLGLLKNFIFFAADIQRKSVVIGPTKLNQKGSGHVPETLEHGGTYTLKRRHQSGRYSTSNVTIQSRPFMQPAFDRELERMPGWAADL